MLVLSRADLERILVPADVVEAIATGFREHAEGRATVPPRSVAEVGDDGLLLLMPAATRPSSAEAGAVGAKILTYHAANRARGHPTIHASYLLMDGETGRPRALLEGTFLTALRTGATSALAARSLAREDARRVLCIGAGAQAGFQLACLAGVRPIERVVVAGRDPARAATFVQTLRARSGLPVDLCHDPRAAAREADIVTCATTSATPVVFGADLRPGTHVDLVGAFRPTDREADTEVIRRARVVVDTYAGALHSAGDLLIPLGEGAIDRGHVAAELGELVTGRRAGRTRADEITVFKSVGWALEDLVTARLAYNRATAAGVGVEVSLS